MNDNVTKTGLVEAWKGRGSQMLVMTGRDREGLHQCFMDPEIYIFILFLEFGSN